MVKKLITMAAMAAVGLMLAGASCSQDNSNAPQYVENNTSPTDAIVQNDGGSSSGGSGTLIQAEDYSAFFDTTPGNSGAAYRSDDVDIEPTADVGGGYDVSWTAATEWLAFKDIHFPTTGSYTIQVRVASPNSGKSLSLDLNAGSIVLGTVNVPNTGGWQNWQTVSFNVSVNAGTYDLGLYAITGGWNVNWIKVIPAGRDSSSGDPTWSDEFNSINTATWNFETGGSGSGNSELEYYTNGANASIQYSASADSNVLVIEARKEDGHNCWYGACQYTSTRMTTQNKHEFTYGRVEARIKTTQTQGGWPAFWMLGSNITSVPWPACGEIDIMEHVNNDPLIHGTIHWEANGQHVFNGSAATVNVSTWHVYAIERDHNEIRWYVDGNLYKTANIANGINDASELQNKFFILLNFAVGGQWPGSPDASSTFPQKMYVDYIRYYKYN